MSHQSPPETETKQDWVKPQRGLADYFGLFWRGMAMGASDVVPGVSGGTMAFILGIYEELINSIRRFTDKAFLQTVLSFNPKRIWQEANWEFLFLVAAGLFTAVITLSPFLEFALRDHPVYVWSFFFGLVLASVFSVNKRIPKWRPALVGIALLGLVFAFLLVGFVPATTPDTWWFLILTGMLAVCAFILPGISGSFILVLLGKYEYVLGAVNDRDIVVVGLVGIGAVIGLVTIARLLSWLFANYHDNIVALLIGFMLGSLRKVWPWKIDLAFLTDTAGNFVLNSDGEKIVSQQANFFPLLPPEGIVVPPTEIITAVGLMLLGLAVVLLLEWIANREEARHKRQNAPAS